LHWRDSLAVDYNIRKTALVDDLDLLLQGPLAFQAESIYAFLSRLCLSA